MIKFTQVSRRIASVADKVDYCSISNELQTLAPLITALIITDPFGKATFAASFNSDNAIEFIAHILG